MTAELDPLTLSRVQIREMEVRLSELRHNVNNHLSLIIAAVELIHRKPDLAARMIDTIAEQPPKILKEIRGFSDHLEEMLQIVREKK